MPRPTLLYCLILFVWGFDTLWWMAFLFVWLVAWLVGFCILSTVSLLHTWLRWGPEHGRASSKPLQHQDLNLLSVRLVCFQETIKPLLLHCQQQQGLHKRLLNELLTGCEWDQREVLARARDKQGFGGREGWLGGEQWGERPKSLFCFSHMDTFAVQKALLNSRLSVDKSPLATMCRNNKYPKLRKLFEVYYKNNWEGSTKISSANPIRNCGWGKRRGSESLYCTLILLRTRGFESLSRCN